MNILKTIQTYAGQFPGRPAFQCGRDVLTYGELWDCSDRLAAWILENGGSGREPVAVYGHKHPWMLICFLACVKAGRAYCPIDISVPDARVELILQALPSDFVFAAEELKADAGSKRVIGRTKLQEILSKEVREVPAREQWVSGDETYYIIFTSGSTGTPKGVQISADCLSHYLDWSVGLGSSAERKQGQVFLNQAPFSFDLSVMDLYTSLASGGTLYCLEKAVQGDFRLLMQHLQESGANIWVSTPSFADVCLSERSFGETLMPGLEVFLFCGETLTNRTAHRLQERFPNAAIVNTYGPTESTVAVTDVLVMRELEAQESPLPVGRAKPGTRIEIHDADGKVLPEGEKGEIIIIGDTVSTGYYGRPDLTEKAFFRCTAEPGRAAESENGRAGNDAEADAETGEGLTDSGAGTQKGSTIRAYRTGDKGYLKNGMLYYCGRIDLQVKLHGYRIELEDIESNICKLEEVEQAVVVPNSRGGKVSSLTAYIVERENSGADAPEAGSTAEKANENTMPEAGSTAEKANENTMPEAGSTAEKINENTMPEAGSTAEKTNENMMPEAGSTEQKTGRWRTAGQAPAAARASESREAAARIREQLKAYLPDYMIPKKIVFLAHMPMTNNGKADRKALMAGMDRPEAKIRQSAGDGAKRETGQADDAGRSESAGPKGEQA